MTRARLALLLLPLLASACLLRGGSAGSVERVQTSDVLALVSRMETFYAALENRSLDTIETFDDTGLRAFFRSDQEFSDYYASLASQLRRANFRNASPERVRIHSFRLPDEDTAVVQVSLEGRHLRGLRFWGLEVSRVDTWRQTERGWVLSPDKL